MLSGARRAVSFLAERTRSVSGAEHREAYDALATSLKGLETEFAALTPKPEELTRIARRSFELRQELGFLLESNERNFVYWYERRNKGVFLAATPIDVSQILREHLFEKFDTVVLTSATLTVGGRFEFIRQRMGLDHAKEIASCRRNSITASKRCCTCRALYPTCAILVLRRTAADEIVRLAGDSPRGARSACSPAMRK